MIASRMDSTGYVFKIHMPEKCLELLKSHVIYDATKWLSKGKGSMKTVFVTGKKKKTVAKCPLYQMTHNNNLIPSVFVFSCNLSFLNN